MGPVVIRTERLALRAWGPEDIDDVVALFDDPEVARFITHGKPVSRSDGETFITRYMRLQSERGWARWAVEVAEEPGVLAGFCGVGCTFAPEIELGWTFRRDLWGHGYATEAARGALDYCFGVVGFERIISAIDPANTRSAAVAHRLGMSQDGTLEHEGQTISRYAIMNPLPRPPCDPEFVRNCTGETAGSSLSDAP